MSYVPLKKFYQRRLGKMKAIAVEEMGVVNGDRVRIGGYITGHYRQVESLRDILERRKKVGKLLAKYV